MSRIVARKREELARAASTREQLEQQAADGHARRRDFKAAISARKPAIIAEIKRASPSRGAIAAGLDVPAQARAYERGGAAALSVLTDQSFFGGSLGDLAAARGATALPVLRKDFTIDEFHVIEAAAAGADAILLIAAILDAPSIRHLGDMASRFGMAAVVEVHDANELDVALDAGAEIIGLNNRNLRTFEVNLETSLQLAPKIPAGIIKVSESGIQSAADIRKLTAAGFDAFLVGEHLMLAADPAAALQALVAAS